ncbi:MAG: cell division protein FtsL [Desulfobulbaceae bacterium]|nr:cell division protein FtsL [Desulfobulbaceae bacterium]
MITDYSPRFKDSPKRMPGKRGPGQKMTIGEVFWKLSGVLVICTTLIGLAGSFWFSWKIRTGLDDLSREQERRKSLQQISMTLQEDEKRLFDQKRIEKVAAAELELYVPSQKYIGGGITVRVPKP